MQVSGRLTGLLLLLSTLLLSACQFPLFPLVREAPPGIPSDSSAKLKGSDLRPPPNLLKYYDWLRRQPEDIQQREYEISRANYDAEPNALNRLRLALVLCLPQASFRDYATAGAMMTEFLDETADERAEDRGLAHLVLGFVEQNRKAQRERSAAQQQLTTEQQTTESLEKRVNELEITVEQLKAIEDSIMETEQSINVPAPPAAN